MTSPNGDSTPNPDDLLRAERHAALRRLAASLSHALGTPLNVISGRAELIELDSEGLPDVLDSAQTIRRQALRISEMLKQVLAQLDHLDEDAESSSIAALLEIETRTLGPDDPVVAERRRELEDLVAAATAPPVGMTAGRRIP